MNSQHETIPSLFARQVAHSGARPAIFAKRDGDFRPRSWHELAADVRRLAAALVLSGIEPGDRVVQLSENRYEWIVADLAIQFAQAVHVPVHATLTGEQVAFQIQHSGARLVLLSNDQQARKVAACRERFAADQVAFVGYEPCAVDEIGLPLESLAEFTSGADVVMAGEIERAALAQLTPDSPATILYTSGTTGEPKGVLLSQRNLAANALATSQAFDYRPTDRRLAFLPLSHIFARTCDLYTWIVGGFELAVAESRETVIGDCAAFQPTTLNGVPYFWEKLYRVLVEHGLADQPGSLRTLLGGEILFGCSGGAALPDHVFDFYQAQGVPLLQGYGLSETSPVIAVSTLAANRRGCVGRPIPGVEVRIAGDGEILTRGPHVMTGYWQDPAATADTIRDGWLHTGDLGELDADGFLHITGRKKELIVTSAGKNIAPVYLESLLTQDPLISQAVVIGDGRSYLTALLVLDEQPLRVAAEQRHIACSSPEELLAHPQILDLIAERVRQRLASVSHHEQVRKFVLLPQPFSIESGELTPKLTLRRQIIAARHADRIRTMYS